MASFKNPFSQLPDSIQTVLKKAVHECQPTKIVLFGSRARGTARESSDYDIAFDIPEVHFQSWNNFLVDIDDKPYSLLGMDLVRLSDLNEDYLAAIREEGVLLYG